MGGLGWPAFHTGPFRESGRAGSLDLTTQFRNRRPCAGFHLNALKLKRCKDSPANAGVLFQPEGGLGGEGPEAPRPAQLPLHWSRLTDKQSFILSACVKRIPALWEGLEGCVRFSFQP